MKLDNIKKAYLIGIKGSGMAAIAQILRSSGIEVSGSDTDEKFFTDSVLERLGINYFQKFDPKNIPSGIDLVVYSTAYNENNNSEMKCAKENGLALVSYPEILAYLFNQKFGIAVSGTHGKTTTSAMLSEVFRASGKDPQAVIGSTVINWESNALIGKGEYFIAETDEYQNKLRFYNPKIVVLTSADFDHPDYFKDFEDYKKVFKDFVARIPKSGFLVVCGDNTETIEISKSCPAPILTYGFSEGCDYRISNLKYQKFEISFRNKLLGEFEVQLIGRHNVLNAAAVVAVCHKLKLDMKKIQEALRNFKGTARRFEYLGERNGAIIMDDYGHHPEEIKATLKGAREIYPEKNIWAVFHPHTFSRTKALLAEFSQSFSDANKVIVLDIYGSAREARGGVHSKDLVDLINKFELGKAEYIPTIPEAVECLKDKIGKDDVVITIGAGNVWEVGEKLSEPLIST